MPTCPNCRGVHETTYCPACGYRLADVDVAPDDACAGPADGTQQPGYLANRTDGEVPSSAAGGHVEPPATDELWDPRTAEYAADLDTDAGESIAYSLDQPTADDDAGDVGWAAAIAGEATLTVDGHTHTIAVDGWEMTHDDETDEWLVEVTGRIVETDPTDDHPGTGDLVAYSGDTGAFSPYERDADDAPDDVYEQLAEVPAVPAPMAAQAWFTADAPDDDDEDVSVLAPDDGLCEVCEEAEWTTRMWSQDVAHYFFYCEDCADQMREKFPDLVRC